MSNAQELITQSYVMAEEDVRYTLSYYIVTQTDSSGSCYYGIAVAKQNVYCPASVSVSKTFSSDKDEVEALIWLFARNYVFPSSLNDIIEDYLLK